MVEPTGDPTTLKKEERAMRPTPEVVRKWSSTQIYEKQDKICKNWLIISTNLRHNWANIGEFIPIIGYSWPIEANFMMTWTDFRGFAPRSG